MKKQLYRGFLFSIPIFLLFGFIFIIDPYEFINAVRIIGPDKKLEVLNRNDESGPRGNMLWKTIHFKRKPVRNILIGDSQCRLIDANQLEEYTGEPWFNLCVPGASYETMIDNFWFANSQTKLEKVYFEVSFMNFNDNRCYNITHFASDYFEKPYLYFTKKEILFDAWANMRYAISGNKQLVQNSDEYAPVEEMDLIAYQRLNLFFSEYSYPDSIYNELRKIAIYCDENDIELIFLIMPTYKEVKTYLKKHDLWESYMRFKSDIALLGKLIDYDVGLKISDKRENFIDFFHSRDYIIQQITSEIWGPNPLNARVKTYGFYPIIN